MHNPVRPIARLATTGEVEEIRRVCSEGRRATYTGWQSEEFIEEVIGEFYVPDKVAQEVGPHGESWGGYVVAELDGQILVAGDGEVIEPTKRELFVLYADPARRRQGGGAAVFSFITAQQRELGAVEQWVSVKPGNETGLPFYRSQGFVEQERPSGPSDRSIYAARVRRLQSRVAAGNGHPQSAQAPRPSGPARVISRAGRRRPHLGIRVEPGRLQPLPGALTKQAVHPGLHQPSTERVSSTTLPIDAARVRTSATAWPQRSRRGCE